MLVNPNDQAQTKALAEQYTEMVKSGTAPHSQSPAGAALLAAYNRHKAAERSHELEVTATASALAMKAMTVSAEERKKIQRKAKRKEAKRAATAAAVRLGNDGSRRALGPERRP